MKKALMTLLLSSSAMVFAGESKSFFSVPFPIQINGETLPAGQYKVIAKSSALDQLRIVNMETGLSVLLNSTERDALPQFYRQRPSIAFRCEQNSCGIASRGSLQPGMAPQNSYLRVVDLSSRPSQSD